MREHLRMALVCVFVGLAILVVVDPAETKHYASVRYESLMGHIGKWVHVPATKIKDVFMPMPSIFVFGLSDFLLLGAIAIYADIKLVMIVYAYIVVTAGLLLHIPYDTQPMNEYPVNQSRKLIFTLAICFCILICIGQTPPKPQEEKKKTE